MSEKEQLTKKFLMVDMNEIGISTDEMPIIGTQALAPCIGFILYNKQHKRAIVGHLSADTLMSNEKMRIFRINLLEILYKNKLLDLPLDLTITQGAYPSKYQLTSMDSPILSNEKLYYSLLEVLEINIKQTERLNVVSTNIIKENNNDIQIVDEYGSLDYKEGATLSKQFAFDAQTGEFVTNKVYFGKDYLRINKQHTK